MPLRSVLEGIRILDLTMNLPGPLATQILADFGADVIKIESPKGDPVRYYPPFIDQVSMYHLSLNRNKRSVVLDLKSNTALNILYELVKTSDVVIIGFLPSTVKKLKIDYETLIKKNPSLIYCHLTGYKDDDDRAGHDLNYIGEGGILHLTGPKQKPIVPGVPIADVGGGSLPTVITVLAALLQRSEKSQYHNISMLEHLTPFLTIAASDYLAGMGDPERELHALSGFMPWYRTYKTKDEQYVTFAPLEDKFWVKFCLAVDREDLSSEQFNLELCEKELTTIFSQRSLEEWNQLFIDVNLPAGPILSLEDVLKKKDRLMTVNHPDIGPVQLLTSPYLHSSAKEVVKAAPVLGQHTEEILRELELEKEN